MRNLKFLIGALGGAMGGYLLSNRKLRRQLSEARNANEAAKILGREIQRSGKLVAKEAKEWMGKPEVQEKLEEWRRYLKGEGAKLKKRTLRTASRAARAAKKNLPAVARRAKAGVSESYRKAKEAIIQ